MGKFLSQETFSYFWKNKLKPLLDSKVNAVSGKGLSTNDYTNADKQAIDSLEDSVIALQSTKLDKTGNAASANRLATSVQIGSAVFDGSKDISLEQIGAAAKEHTHPLPTLDELGAAAKEHTHPLPTAKEIGAATEDHTHPLPTLDELGAAAKEHTHPLPTAKEIGAAEENHTHPPGARVGTFYVTAESWEKNDSDEYAVAVPISCYDYSGLEPILVTKDSWILVDLDEPSTGNFKSAIVWTTDDGKIEFTTSEQPTGDIYGRIVVMEASM